MPPHNVSRSGRTIGLKTIAKDRGRALVRSNMFGRRYSIAPASAAYYLAAKPAPRRRMDDSPILGQARRRASTVGRVSIPVPKLRHVRNPTRFDRPPDGMTDQED